MMKMNGGSPTKTMEEDEPGELSEMQGVKEVKSSEANSKDALKENHDSNQKPHSNNCVDIDDKEELCNGDFPASTTPTSSKSEDSLNDDIAETLKALDELQNGVNTPATKANNENKVEKDEPMELDLDLETRGSEKEGNQGTENNGSNGHEHVDKKDGSIDENMVDQNHEAGSKEKSLPDDATKTPNEKKLSASSNEKDSNLKETESAKKGKEINKGNKHSKFVIRNTHEESEKMRPVASAIHSLGVDLVRQQMYKELIRIQTHKHGAGKSPKTESPQLRDMIKLEEELQVKNRPYELRVLACTIENCDFKTESHNVMAWHKEFPHTSGPNNEAVCAICKEFKSSSVQETFQHMDRVHNRKGRFYVKTPLYQCHNCPFECNTRQAYNKHSKKCDDTFRLKRNLEPTPQDCDIPTKKPKVAPKMTSKPVPVLSKQFKAQHTPTRPIINTQLQSVLKPSQSSRLPLQTVKQALAMQQKQPASGQVTVGGQLYTIALNKGQYVLQPFNQIQTPVVSPPLLQMPANRSAVQITPPSTHSPALAKHLQINSPSYNKVNKDQPKTSRRVENSATNNEKSAFEICEICGGFVKDKESLRVHFYWAHKVDIHEEVFKRKVPHLKCGLCQSNFWTYQGLAKHKEVKHSKKSVYTCFICGMKGTQILSHMKVVHNLTLEKALAKKVCVACGLQFRDVASVQTHIFQTHKTIFKEEVFPQKAAKDRAAAALGTMAAPRENNDGQGGRAVPTGLFKNSVPNKAPVSSPRSVAQKEVKKKYTPVCSICNIPFPNLDAFTAHCNEKHIFKCYRCGEKWSSPELRHRHWLKAHKQDVDKCPICKEEVVIGRPFIRHVTAQHVKECSVQIQRMSKKDFDYYMKRLDTLADELAEQKESKKNATVIVLDDSDDDNEKLPSRADKSSKPEIVVKTLRPVEVEVKTLKPIDVKQSTECKEEDSDALVVNKEILHVDGEEIVVEMASDDEEDPETQDQDEKSDDKVTSADDQDEAPNGKENSEGTKDSENKESDGQNKEIHHNEIGDEDEKAQKENLADDKQDDLKINADKTEVAESIEQTKNQDKSRQENIPHDSSPIAE